MRRLILLLAVGALILSQGDGSAGPLRGPQKKEQLLSPGAYAITEIFKGGQRACAIVVGDHDPVVNIKLQVFDQNKNLVGQDEGPGDFVAVMWYPERDAPYTIQFEFRSEIKNKCSVILK